MTLLLHLLYIYFPLQLIRSIAITNIVVIILASAITPIPFFLFFNSSAKSPYTIGHSIHSVKSKYAELIV